jgi:hypothetical protein
MVAAMMSEMSSSLSSMVRVPSGPTMMVFEALRPPRPSSSWRRGIFETCNKRGGQLCVCIYVTR